MPRAHSLRACVLFVAFASLTACASIPPRPSPAPGATTAAGDPCAAGAAQSPIAIDPASSKPSALAPPTFHYSPTAVTLWNNGKDLQADYSAGAGNAIVLDGVRFELLQFHFHRPVEHPIQGLTAEMEVHLVHADARGNLAVVGIPIAIGGDGAGLLDRLFGAIPAGDGWRALLPLEVDANQLLPAATLPAFRYPGSLTTPPYTECVRWTVLGQPILVSKPSYEAYLRAFPKPNARGPQPLNGRTPLRAEMLPLAARN